MIIDFGLDWTYFKYNGVRHKVRRWDGFMQLEVWQPVDVETPYKGRYEPVNRSDNVVWEYAAKLLNDMGS